MSVKPLNSFILVRTGSSHAPSGKMYASGKTAGDYSTFVYNITGYFVRNGGIHER